MTPIHPKPAVQTLARTLAMTGCRVSEALAVRACDVDLDAAEIRIATLKRRRAAQRAVPTPEDLIQALDLVHRLGAALASVRARTKRTWPVTRQTAARQISALMSDAVTAGVPLPTGAAVLGHADLSTTAIYATAIGAEHREFVARVWA